MIDSRTVYGAYKLAMCKVGGQLEILKLDELITLEEIHRRWASRAMYVRDRIA
jgi:hypothetical protein